MKRRTHRPRFQSMAAQILAAEIAAQGKPAWPTVAVAIPTDEQPPAPGAVLVATPAGPQWAMGEVLGYVLTTAQILAASEPAATGAPAPQLRLELAVEDCPPPALMARIQFGRKVQR